MADYKGVGVVYVRKLVREKNCERELVAQLTDEERKMYESCAASSWVPVELAAKLFHVAGELCFPGSPNAIREVGRGLARDNLGGVYRHLLRVMSVAMIIKQTTILWGTYHRSGKASSFSTGPKAFDVLIKEYHDLPERFRECLSGWMAQAVEMTGATNVRVVEIPDADPKAHRWHITWR